MCKNDNMPDHVEIPPSGDIPRLSHERFGGCEDRRQPLLAWAAQFERGLSIGPDRVSRTLMAFSFDGMMRVETEDDRWFIPDRHGIWLPSGERHLITTVSAIEMQVFYIHPRHAVLAAMPEQPTVVRATPLMRGLARRLAPSQAETLSPAERRRLIWVALDEIARLERTDLRLPGGNDPRVMAAVAHLLDTPRDAQNLARLAERIGTSERTLTRLFASETGLSWREWRDRLRFMLALEGLQEGLGSAALAERLGYSSASAFVAAFRRQAGMPPSQWRKQR